MGAGNALFPIDAARRVLEVALLLDKHWERPKLHFTLVLAAPNPHWNPCIASDQREHAQATCSSQ